MRSVTKKKKEKGSRCAYEKTLVVGLRRRDGHNDDDDDDDDPSWHIVRCSGRPETTPWGMEEDSMYMSRAMIDPSARVK